MEFAAMEANMDYLLLVVDSLPVIATTCIFTCEGNYSTGNTIASTDSFEFTLAEVGNWEVRVRSKKYLVSPGQIKVYPPMVPRHALALDDITHRHSTIYVKNIKSHTILSEEQYAKQAMVFKKNKAFSASDFRLLLPIIIDGKSNLSLVDEFHKITKEYLSEGIYSKPNASAMLLRFLTMVSDSCINSYVSKNYPMDGASSIAHRMVTYINNNFSSIKSIKQIADHFNYNSSYLSTVFKNYTGYTTIEYINKLRVEKAKEIIQHENVSFKEIAGRVGIDNIYYFYRIFKKYTDMTMGQYLKMLYR